MHCRIYLEEEFEDFAVVDIDSEQARYLYQVMRLQVGNEITVFNGLGGEYLAKLTVLAKNSGQCVLQTKTDISRELPIRVHIIQAANRSEKIETVLQKATELGATSFQIVNSERATLNLAGNKKEKRLLRWQKIVIEAAEQSERTALPQVAWLDKISQIQAVGKCFILHPRDAMLWQDVRNQIMDCEDVTLAVGPEGGWTNKELEILQQQGFSPLTFGARIMRTETAAPALLAAIQAVL
ncbi:MAG: 16S rRNA (uracil(1498)-N(3))-methyltransferase [Ghiorsea sp.]